MSYNLEAEMQAFAWPAITTFPILVIVTLSGRRKQARPPERAPYPIFIVCVRNHITPFYQALRPKDSA
jgi:hypothetical protein